MNHTPGIKVKIISLLLITLLIPTNVSSNNDSILGEWLITPVYNTKEQTPGWVEIKYPKRLVVSLINNEYSFIFIDQYDFKCEGKPLMVNNNKEMVFEFCGGLGTKHPQSWGPIHHAKIINGKLHGVVTSNRLIFNWAGEKSK